MREPEGLLLPEVGKSQSTNAMRAQDTEGQTQDKGEEDALKIFNIKATLAALALSYDG